MLVTQVWLLQTGNHLRQAGPAASTINGTIALAALALLVAQLTGESSFPRTLCASFFFASLLRWLPAFCDNTPKRRKKTAASLAYSWRRAAPAPRARTCYGETFTFAQRGKTRCVLASLLK